MAIRINTNVDSVFAQKNVARTQRSLRSSMQQLSSGLRITKAADDAAAMGVSEKMRAQITSLRMASRNTNDGISRIQTAEGALDETADILSRMRELAVEASSEVLQATERAYLATEFTALQGEIERIADSTQFNGLSLSDGTTTSVAVQVGIFNVAAEDRITVTLQDSQTASLAVNTAAVALSSAANSQSAITAIDTAIDSVNNSRATYGAAQNQLSSALRNLENYTENLVETESRIRDVDFASATADLTRNQIFQQAGIAILSQANSAPQAALSLLS
ncbi:MAG: flagellin [Myxococcota bacterium]|nr:flagellin [Myxococcota bacterium]